MKLIILVSLAVVGSMADFCEQRGNVYTPFPGTDCRYFDQRKGNGPVPENTLVKSHACPASTKFDTTLCICNHEDQVDCPPNPVPEYCEARGNVYTPIPNTGCTKFDHRAGKGPIAVGDLVTHHSCPRGTMFNVVQCTCSHPDDGVCAL